MLFPAGRPLRPESPDELGLTASATPTTEGGLALGVRSERLAYGVRVHAPGFRAEEDAFTLEPGRGRTILLSPSETSGAAPPEVTLTALNLAGRVRAETAERRP